MHGTTPKNSTKLNIHFIVLGLIYAFQCGVFNSLPFIYFRDSLECKVEGETYSTCEESQICASNCEFRFTNNSGMKSISMDYNLVCAARITEATIISTGFIGQVTAFTIAVLTELPKDKKAIVLFAAVFIEGAALFSVYFVTDNIAWIMVVVFLWNFIFSYIYSQVFAYINETYSEAIKEKSVNVLNMFWTSGALVYILYAQIDGDWVDHLAFFSGASLLLLSIPFLLLMPTKQEVGRKHSLLVAENTNKLSLKEEAKITQKNYIDDLREKFNSLLRNKRYKKNSIILIMCWALIQLSYSTPFIAFNYLGGSVKVNVLISVVVDVSGSFLAFYLLSTYDPLKVLFVNIGVTGFIQSMTYFSPPATAGYFTTLSLILITKLSTRVGLTNMLTILPFVLPYQYNQLVFNISNIMSILMSTMLPFYKYFMEVNGLNIFLGIGIASLLLLMAIAQFSMLEDENVEIKAARISKDFRGRKSSFAPMKRNSDIIIENILRKSSMIANSAAFHVLDKQSVHEERSYFQQQKKQSELVTIHEI